MAKAQPSADPDDLARRAAPLFSSGSWEPLCDLLSGLPPDFDNAWLDAADRLAFALGQLGERGSAVRVLERCWQLRQTYRVAAALTYQHYAASLDLIGPPGGSNRGDGGGRGAQRGRRGGSGRGGRVVCERFPAPEGWPNRQSLHDGFRRWLPEALELATIPSKELYRLGIFEAQVQSARDKHAVKAFLAAIESYQRLEPATRERRHDLRKVFVKALYAGGRSALRVNQPKLARKLSFQCIREDEAGKYVLRLHQLGLAGRACLAVGEVDHAERAFRLALDAKGPRRRDYLYGYLAEVAQKRGELDAAAEWIERKVPPERRSAALWRQLGDVFAQREAWNDAESAYRSALTKDRGGKHLTFVRLGDVLLHQDRNNAAEKAFRKALDFRRRRYSSVDREAEARLARMREEREARAATGGPGLASTVRGNSEPKRSEEEEQSA